MEKQYIKRKGENLMPNKIPSNHAQIILRDSARFPTEGSQCDASCAFYWCCENSQDFGECKGFVLLNHGNLEHIKRTLDEHIDEYIQNSYQAIQRCLDNGTEDMGDIILRDIDSIGKQFSNKRQPSGFIAMLESAHPTTPSEPEPQEPSQSDFQRMLSESGKNTVVERQVQTIPSILFPTIDESQFPDLCDPTKCPKDFARHCRANTENHWGKPCIYKTPKNR